MTKLEYVLLWIILFLLAITILGCNIQPRPEYFNNKLKAMINMNNQTGAIIGYNIQNINSPYQIGNIPNNQLTWMQWHIMNVKLNKHIRR